MFFGGCFALVQGNLHSSYASEAGADTYEQNDVKSAVLQSIDNQSKRWEDVNSWLIEYEVLPELSAGGEFTSVHRIVAAAAPGELYHMGAHIPGR